MNVKREGKCVGTVLSVLIDLDHMNVSAHEVTQEIHTTVYAHLAVSNVSMMVTVHLMRDVCNQVNVSVHHPSLLTHWMAISAKVCLQYINITTRIYKMKLSSFIFICIFHFLIYL